MADLLGSMASPQPWTTKEQILGSMASPQPFPAVDRQGANPRFRGVTPAVPSHGPPMADLLGSVVSPQPFPAVEHLGDPWPAMASPSRS